MIMMTMGVCGQSPNDGTPHLLTDKGDINITNTQRTKLIYFTVGPRLECAEFPADTLSDDVKDIFRSAAEAGNHDILKLYNERGNIVNICARLETNSPDQPYKLQVVAAHCPDDICIQYGIDIQDLEKRLQTLERRILVDAGETPSAVYEMRSRIDRFRDKLENVEYLSWLGLFKDMSSSSALQPIWDKQNPFRKSSQHNKTVFEKFMKMSNVHLSGDVCQVLRQPTFDTWQWEDAEMLVLMQQMYIDLDFVTTFNIEPHILQQFLYEVYKNYNNVPFHNFRHAFCVTQMMYAISWTVGLCDKIGPLDVMALITSAICHDLDHPGYNNAYQINARTELALRYNDISPLENHHCSVAFEILEKPQCNIFRNTGTQRYKKIREVMIRCVLATDMAQHNEILNKFKAIKQFDFSNKEHIEVLHMILIKVADISNEARPMEVAEPWLDCLLQEFFNQSDVEKLEGLPVAPFMDREKVTKCSSQTGFISFVLLPLFQSLAQLFPLLEPHIIQPVHKALSYYSEMDKALKQEQKRRHTSNKDLSGGDDDKKSEDIQLLGDDEIKGDGDAQ